MMRTIFFIVFLFGPASVLAQTPETLPPICTDDMSAATRTLFMYCNNKRASLNLPLIPPPERMTGNPVVGKQ